MNGAIPPLTLYVQGYVYRLLSNVSFLSSIGKRDRCDSVSYLPDRLNRVQKNIYDK